MKRIVGWGLVAAFTLGASRAALAAPEIQVTLWTPRCGLREGTPGRSATFTLRNRSGSLKGVCVAYLSSGTEASCSFSDGVLVLPGDRLTLEHAGSRYATGNLAGVTITRVEISTDKVSARISPRRGAAFVRASGERFTLSGRDAVTYSRTARPSANGSFTVDLTAAGRIRRNDLLEVGYREGRFEIFRAARVPGLVIAVGRNEAVLGGEPGRRYDVSLRRADGTLRGTTATVVGEDCRGPIRFFNRALRPLTIAAGQKISVAGTWGFTDTVEALTLSADADRDLIRVRAAPRTVIEIRAVAADGSWTDLAKYRKTDPAGSCIYKMPLGKYLRPGDEVFVEYQDRQGNRLTKRAVAR